MDRLLDSCQLAEGLEAAPGKETKPEDLSVAEYLCQKAFSVPNIALVNVGVRRDERLIEVSGIPARVPETD